MCMSASLSTLTHSTNLHQNTSSGCICTLGGVVQSPEKILEIMNQGTEHDASWRRQWQDDLTFVALSPGLMICMTTSIKRRLSTKAGILHASDSAKMEAMSPKRQHGPKGWRSSSCWLAAAYSTPNKLLECRCCNSDAVGWLFKRRLVPKKSMAIAVDGVSIPLKLVDMVHPSITLLKWERYGDRSSRSGPWPIHDVATQWTSSIGHLNKVSSTFMFFARSSWNKDSGCRVALVYSSVEAFLGLLSPPPIPSTFIAFDAACEEEAELPVCPSALSRVGSAKVSANLSMKSPNSCSSGGGEGGEASSWQRAPSCGSGSPTTRWVVAHAAADDASATASFAGTSSVLGGISEFSLALLSATPPIKLFSTPLPAFGAAKLMSRVAAALAASTSCFFSRFCRSASTSSLAFSSKVAHVLWSKRLVVLATIGVPCPGGTITFLIGLDLGLAFGVEGCFAFCLCLITSLLFGEALAFAFDAVFLGAMMHNYLAWTKGVVFL